MTKMGRPKSENTKKKVLSIRVSDQLYSQLLAYAEKHNMTTTDVVLRGVEAFISKQEEINESFFHFGRRKTTWQRQEKICEEGR